MNLADDLKIISTFVLPVLIVGFPLFGLCRRVRVYEEFVQGAKSGFETAVKIIPYLVAILFAIAMFRASGAMDLLAETLSPVLKMIGMPADLLPMAIVRPLTGSGSGAVLADLVKQHGAGSPVARMAATIYGSTETTFYVVAVYFGAVNIRKVRHALAVGLLADFTGVVFAVWLIRHWPY